MDVPKKKALIFSVIIIAIIVLIISAVIAVNYAVRTDPSTLAQNTTSNHNQSNMVEQNTITLNANNGDAALGDNKEDDSHARTNENTSSTRTSNDTSSITSSETISGKYSESADRDLSTLYGNNGSDLSAFADTIPQMYDTPDNEVDKYKTGGMAQRYSMCKYKDVVIQDKSLVSSNSEYERYNVTIKSTMYDIVTMSVGSQAPREKELIENWDIVIDNAGKIVYLANKSRE